jgi:hypothetical protein
MGRWPPSRYATRGYQFEFAFVVTLSKVKIRVRLLSKPKALWLLDVLIIS